MELVGGECLGDQHDGYRVDQHEEERDDTQDLASIGRREIDGTSMVVRVDEEDEEREAVHDDCHDPDDHDVESRVFPTEDLLEAKRVGDGDKPLYGQERQGEHGRADGGPHEARRVDDLAVDLSEPRGRDVHHARIESAPGRWM